MLSLAGVLANTGVLAGGGGEGVRVEFGWPLFNSDDGGGRVTGKILQVEPVLCAPSDLHVISQRGQSPEDVQGWQRRPMINECLQMRGR